MTLVCKAFNKKPVTGDVGIELEFEGERLPVAGFEGFWNKCADGSLRGESAEYVLRKPIPRDKVADAIKNLTNCFNDSGTIIHDTFRAGTHIHINVQDLTLPQIINFLTIYFMFETTLVKTCREDRLGNHFCLRGQDASALIDMLYKAVTTGSVYEFSSDQFRYGAVNITSLPKFGSLEFRALESSTDWAKLSTWIDMHLSIRDMALKFKDPVDILGAASAEGFEGFGKRVFGANWEVLKDVYEEHDVCQGVWAIQPVVYAKNWAEMNHNIFAGSNIFDVTP